LHMPAQAVPAYCAPTQYMTIVLIMCSVAVRLASNSINRPHNAGRVEVYYDGRWGSICSSGFDISAAKVACYMLGFG